MQEVIEKWIWFFGVTVIFGNARGRCNGWGVGYQVKA